MKKTQIPQKIYVFVFIIFILQACFIKVGEDKSENSEKSAKKEENNPELVPENTVIEGPAEEIKEEVKEEKSDLPEPEWNYHGTIGNSEIRMFLGEANSPSGGFWNREGYYFYIGQNKKIAITAAGHYTVNTSESSISEFDIYGNVQATFNIENTSASGASNGTMTGTWTMPKTGASYRFIINPK